MKKIFLKMIIVFVGLALVSCEAEDLKNQDEEYNSRMLSVFIYDSDIVGEWDLKSLITEDPVDLNQDGESSTNLLAETDCFDPVWIRFNGDKTFSSVNYSMEFKKGEDGDEFICKGRTTQNGEWSLNNNTLILYVWSNGALNTIEREIILTEDSFIFEINAAESEDYVKNLGGASASGISVVALEYSPSEK